jgi:hypothetical protein
MPFPTVDEFSDAVRTRPADDIVAEYILQGDRFFFRDWPGGFDVMRDHIATALEVDPAGIALVGSGKIGFSVKPTEVDFGRPFRTKSDLDVIIVSSELFDRAWHALLRWHYPHGLDKGSGEDATWEEQHRKDIYRGYVYPPGLKYHAIGVPVTLHPVRDLRAKWLDAINGLSRLDARFGKRTIKSRLYRNWVYANLYHSFGIRQLRKMLEG